MIDFVDCIECGDALEVLRRLPDGVVDLVVTSPPYPGVYNLWGALYHPSNYEQAHRYLSSVWDECVRVLRDGCKLCINIANTKRRPYLPNTYKIYSWAEGKVEALGEIIWDKGYGQLGTAWGSYCNPSDPSLADQHEYILIFRKPGRRRRLPGYHIGAMQFKSWRNSIWRIPPAHASATGHVAPFPIEIPYRLISLYSYEGELVLDPFIGAGTTAVAAVRLNRHYFGIDINEEYCLLSKANIQSEREQLSLL